MPAVTFRHSTTQSSQNCGVLIASSTWTWRRVISVLAAGAGGSQPAGFQPGGGHPEAEGAGHHGDEVDHAQRDEGLGDARPTSADL